MGASDYGIRQDDFVRDVIGAFEEALKRGGSVRDATSEVTSKFAVVSGDRHYGALFRIALAEVQWTYGALEPEVLRKVQDDFESGRSLALWSDDAAGLSRRRTVLERFIAKIRVPNARSKTRARTRAGTAKTTVRAPQFQPGDCLSVRLSNGQYGAALVLAANHSQAENGRNLIGMLDYLSPQQPSLDVFRGRQWLVRNQVGGDHDIDLAWYLDVGFRSAKRRLDVMGRVDVLDSDPKDSSRYCGWTEIGEQVIPQRGTDASTD